METPQTPQTESPMPPKQPSHLPLALISVILSGLIFGLLGYWYGSTAISTANWKTYMSTTEKLSFKYPPTWTKTNSIITDPGNSDNLSLVSPNGTLIEWVAAIPQLYGMCSPAAGMESTLVSAEQLRSAKGLYLITYSVSVKGKQEIDLNYGVVDGAAPTIGEKLFCPHNPMFKSKANKSPDNNALYNNMTLRTVGQVSASDQSTLKLIFESLTY